MKAIFTYHSIDDSGSPISLSRSAFAGHAQWLTSGRVKVLSIADLVAHPDDGYDAVSVTFDEAFESTRLPVQSLLAGGVPVTMFVVNRYVGKTNSWGRWTYPAMPEMPLLDWRGLEGLVARGATVGSHTRSHVPLTTLSSAELEEELSGSRDDLQARLGVQTTDLSYPFGDVDPAVAAHASRHFRRACTTEFALVSATADPIQLPRIDMYYFNAPAALDRWGTGGFHRRMAWIRARRSIRARLVGAAGRRQPGTRAGTMGGSSDQ